MADLKITGIQNNNFAAKSVTVPNFCGTKTNPVPQDTVEISDKKKKNNLAVKLLLGALGVGAVVLAFIKFHKTNPAKEELSAELKEVQKYLKNIFEKDFSDKETKDFAIRYKEIMKTEDEKEFVNKLFNELKKDYGVETKGLEIQIMDNPEPTKNGTGVLQGYTEALTRWIAATTCKGKINTMKTVFHEMKHVKQNELMYKTDAQRLIRQKVRELEESNNASWQEVLRENNGNIEKARQFVKEEIESVYSKIWGRLKPVTSDNPEYKRGLKYLENEENRIPPGEHYYEQILEKEAQFCENEAEKVMELITR